MMSPSTSSADTVAGTAALSLLGRRVQIAGSASGKTDPALIIYSHEVVPNLVKGVITAGGGLVVGGTGVEHSADLYLSRRKPVVPLDLALGASRDDGTGGAMRLAKEARTEPARFFRFSPAFANTEGAALAEIATRNGAATVSEVTSRTVSLLAKIARPVAFYVRLLNPGHEKFTVVESFFRDVVDPVVDEAGLRRVEIGTDKSDYAFINVGIFES